MSQTIGLAAFFLASTFLVAAFVETLLERRLVYKTLRSGRTGALTPGQIRAHELAPSIFGRVGVPVLRKVGAVGRRFTPAGVVDRLDEELVKAGTHSGWDGERILALKLVGAGAGPVLALVSISRGMLAPKAIFIGAIISFFGWYFPEWAIRSRSGKRQKEIQRALPDALDLLSITVEAGLAFDAAVTRVAAQSGGALGEELRRFLAEMQIGRSRSEALRDLGNRSDVPELKAFTLAMVQAEVFGISIAKVLHGQAREMRIKRRQRAEEKAQKLQIKILLPLLGCIFPSLFVVLLGPAVITVYETLLSK